MKYMDFSKIAENKKNRNQAILVEDTENFIEDV